MHLSAPHDLGLHCGSRCQVGASEAGHQTCQEKAKADMHIEPGLFPAFARTRQIAILAADC
jgi:hypothetical protein